ncbi:hypothetical protein CTAYLR_005981 [Chrysophaeum taylorii]|uniref:Pentacotripeptide-repeat region of PRORP domain-containing protein n=1 Tax=Chrysophaeum taylorii TaxID=2483200 RepID=A0AAD7XN65_9STRA|nr:hypothetical protein CTAYLR_005981 [Chrysophaeum taylorii]
MRPRWLHASRVLFKGRRGGSKAHLPRLGGGGGGGRPPPKKKRTQPLPPPPPPPPPRRKEEEEDDDDDGDLAWLEELQAEYEEIEKKNTPAAAAATRVEVSYSEARVAFRKCDDLSRPAPWLALLASARRARNFEDCLFIADAAFERLPEPFCRNEDGCADRLVSEVVRVAAATRRPAAAWATFEAAEVLGFCDPAGPETYAALMRCCAVQQLPERALNLLGDMRDLKVPRSPEVFAALLDAVAEAPQWHPTYARLVDEVLDEMQSEDIEPSPDVYRALINAAGRCGDARAAAHYFAEMKTRHGLRRDATLYAAVFAALARAQTVGQKFGTRRRALVVPPWTTLGVEPEAAVREAGDVSSDGVAPNVDNPEDAMVTGLGRRRRKDLKERKSLRQPVRFADRVAVDHFPPPPPPPTREEEQRRENPTTDEIARLLLSDEDVGGGFAVTKTSSAAVQNYEPLGAVTRLRELGNEPDLDDSAAGIYRRQERHIAAAEAIFEEMEAPATPATLNAFFSVYTEAMRRRRAREVAERLSVPGVFPNERTNRHLARMLARRGELEAARESLEDADIETIGLVLDAHARKGDLETASVLARRLVDAHAERARKGIGASDERPRTPKLVNSGVFLTWSRPRGPPERLLRAYRQLCRSRKVPQLPDLPIDPVLWRQDLARDKRDPKGRKWIRHKRAMTRAGGG